MARTIKIELTEKSVRDAIKKLESYQSSLENKVDLFLSRLAEIGIDAVRAKIETIPPEDKGTYSVEEIKQPPNSTTILLSGNKVLFIEFGAGVIYSNPQHPKAGELGYGVGTYPNQQYAWNLTKFGGGWMYRDKDTNEVRHSYGNPAYAPLYNAETEILSRVTEVAREVFGE